MTRKSITAAFMLLPCMATVADAEPNLMTRVKHAYADSHGVKIHYVTLGEGPLVVFIHGFPDFWFTWSHQMTALSSRFRCIAVDTRGYNKSDKPKGVDSYAMPLLLNDIEAVIKAEGETKAVIVGHDWGGAIAWNLAMQRPHLVDRLVICNLPHPRGMARELRMNPDQQRNSQYARDFQQPDSHKQLSVEGLAKMRARGDEMRLAAFHTAFSASDLEAMMNYYKANYPRLSQGGASTPLVKVSVPVLMFHGLDDTALHHHGLNNTWEWLDKDLTLVTVPGAGHWVHEDAAELVTRTLGWWLIRDAAP